MIVGTAGHIDHGKTTLVRALTGVDTDRLKEEKARGISIELGYAYTPLSNGDILGFVDVPGHERLVHTMAAGACGIDFALLVIAADDGVMPQTREHVAILQLFGVTAGAVALTKVDRVDDARLRAVEAEVAAFLSGTVFREAPVFRVNAAAADVVGDVGTAELRAYLERVALGTGTADGDVRLFRLAVDRVFTLAGHGTVVAGTVFSGSVRTGDNVVVFPSNIPVRVRSIHSQNRPAEVGDVGDRCALNLAGVDKSALNRGNWLADARALLPTTRIDVRIELLPDTNTVLKAWAPVHFHHGAAHVTAHVVPLDESTITPGEFFHAQIVFGSPICALPGDRFIIRDAQAVRTLGGGIVLDPFAQSRKRRSPERMRYLHALERMISGEGLAPLLAEAPYGVKQSDLVRLTGQSPEQMTLPADAMTVDGARDRYILLSSAWRALRVQAVGALREFHTASPEEPGPDIGRLRRIALPQLPNDLWRAMIVELARDGTLVRSDPWVHLPGHSVTLSPRENALAEKLQPLIEAGRFNPPWVRDLAGTLKAPEDDVRQVLRKQVTQGALYQVVHDLFYDRKCVVELATVITTLAQEHGTVEAAQYRDAVGLGRKRAIQILEFFDRVGHTRRMRDARVLRADSGWRAG
ncbi:MAG TPA: selenocysteine-specific translation elongation factor [Steroidobacteraceae bacterium]|nr:selenocysteine-specific translation elongation factor [Steroidobacteraceae bacterium]